MKEFHWGADFDGEEWGYPEIAVVGTWTHKQTGQEVLIDAETLEVVQTIEDEDWEPNIYVIEDAE